MKKISIILVIAMLAGILALFAGCTGNSSSVDKDSTKDSAGDSVNEPVVVDTSLPGLVAAINEKLPFEDRVSEIIYKEDDVEEMVCWVYGVIDIPAADHLTDYVITMPSDYSQTVALFVFDDEMTDDDYAEVKEVVSEIYTRAHASALQMYMPEEYADVAWALDNPEKVWRQYDNVLALVIYGDSEPTAVWEVLDTAFGK